MLALWSRTVQASRSCQCGPCLQAGARVARTSRGSTAAARRRLRPSDVFTASFSAMLATAAVYDTKKKDERLLQWDQAIEEVRSGKDLATISTPDQVSIGKAADESSNIMGHEVGEYTPDANICRKLGESATTVRHLMSHVPVPILEASQAPPRPRESMTPVWDELQDLVSASLEASGELSAIYGADKRQDYVPDTSPVAVESDRKLLEGSEFAASTMSQWEPRTTYQLDRLARDVNGLVHELWQATSMARKRNVKREFGTDAEMDTGMDDAALEIRQLAELMTPMLDGTMPAPDYPKVGTVGTKVDAASLNATLDSITKTAGFQDRNFDLMLAKICYNLLSSTAVPNVTTYEILIRAFTKLQKKDLAEVVVNRFRNNALRPNEGILSAILMHHGYTRDAEMFYMTIRQMAGLEDGLGLEKHHIFDLTSPSIQQWAMDTDVIHRDGYLQEKAKRNSEIFESLIRGCMNFHNLDGALRYLKTAIKEGCYIRTHVFADLVYYSLTSPQRTDALLRIVTALSWQFAKRERPGGGLDYNSDVRGKIYDVFEACGLGSALSGAPDAADAVLDVEHPLARHIYPEQFAAMVRHFHEEEAKDMASYRERRVPLLQPSRVRQDGELGRTRIEDIPKEFGGMFVKDMPSYVKMSKVAGEEEEEVVDGGAYMTPPQAEVVADGGAYMTPPPAEVKESNFRPMAATPTMSRRAHTALREEQYHGPLEGCF
ncbi:hypothetical protein V495_00819 [Pseudogymnoascus sp. VKM F-4514 (FW-929)]|nr:hypothetical protein V495_00819 [Pseudogymnoascus sp. VKM F-4514 (FW-929)]KFY60530.1 hypothetical protein V497_03594 [Pseudogymnoascus sp. VKM F-4516 (FW-969)]